MEIIIINNNNKNYIYRTYDDKDFDRVTLDDPDVPVMTKTKKPFSNTRLSRLQLLT